MYKKGDLKITDEPCETTDEDGYCDEWGLHKHTISDSRSNDTRRLPDAAYLPHSCDEWVIGWQDEIDALISDLQEIRKAVVARTTLAQKP